MKHFLSVMAIFRSTTNFQEWASHYVWQGAEHFYLINNSSTAPVVLSPQDCIAANNSTSWYHLPEPYKQIEHYNTVYEKIRNETEWLAVVDLDEYIFGTKCPLSKMLEMYDPYAGVYSFWKTFASRDEYEHPESVVDAFTWRQRDIAEEGKGVVRTDCTPSLGIHFHEHYRPVIVDNQLIGLNHYAIQSREFFEKVKMNFGPDIANPQYDGVKDWDYFKRYDRREVLDTTLRDLKAKGYAST